jgi:DNA processing protein
VPEPTITEDLLYQIALTQIPAIGTVLAKALAEKFGSAQTIFAAGKKNLCSVEGITDAKAKSILAFDDFATAAEEIKFIEKYRITTLFIGSKNYPRRLMHCYDAPTLLYYRGAADLNVAKVISIIGTRSHTDYGRQVTEQLLEELKGHNVLVVSGLAYGIDAIAHKAALHCGHPTVGVLAHGLDTIYPAAHKTLAKEMLQHGGLLTEFTQQTKADKHNFPRRNRIVAGMADATIVVETAVKGGSMITAALANNYNRDVFAYPGKTTDPKSEGCNYLIQNNRAVLFTGAEQLLQNMGWEKKKVKKSAQRQLFVELAPDEQTIVDLLKDKDAVHIDELYIKSALSSSTVAAAILNLELQNIIASLPGKMYRLLG